MKNLLINHERKKYSREHSIIRINKPGLKLMHVQCIYNDTSWRNSAIEMHSFIMKLAGYK